MLHEVIDASCGGTTMKFPLATLKFHGRTYMLFWIVAVSLVLWKASPSELRVSQRGVVDNHLREHDWIGSGFGS